jgi:C-5 cytosine-specific DNA methylase
VGKPLAIDLYCGLGGWTEGLLAEGYDVIGFDIERHVYGEHRYPAQLVVQDVLTLHGSQFRDAALIVASPPCQEFSYMAMPWSLAKAKARAIRADATGEMRTNLTRLFDACFRLQVEACFAAGRRIPLLVENVRGAIPWVGRSRWNFGAFHLWGDVPALMPLTIGRRAMKVGIAHRPDGATNFHGQKVPGLNWSDHGSPDYKPKGFNVTAAQRYRAEQGTKVGGSWFGKGNDCSPMRRGSSGSDSRKAASAMIAKIPLPLSRHIAATFRPETING